VSLLLLWCKATGHSCLTRVVARILDVVVEPKKAPLKTAMAHGCIVPIKAAELAHTRWMTSPRSVRGGRRWRLGRCGGHLARGGWKGTIHVAPPLEATLAEAPWSRLRLARRALTRCSLRMRREYTSWAIIGLVLARSLMISTKPS
jgi:hypothetical protein